MCIIAEALPMYSVCCYLSLRSVPRIPLSLQGERTPRTRRERVLRTGRVAPRHSLPLPSFSRRRESIRRHSATDGARSAPSSPDPPPHDCHSRESANLPPPPRAARPLTVIPPHDRHSRASGNPAPFGAQAPTSPSPYKGRGRRERGGRGYCGTGRVAFPSFRRRPESSRRHSATDGALRAPSPLIPRPTSFPRKREPTLAPRPLPPPPPMSHL